MMLKAQCYFAKHSRRCQASVTEIGSRRIYFPVRGRAQDFAPPFFLKSCRRLKAMFKMYQNGHKTYSFRTIQNIAREHRQHSKLAVRHDKIKHDVTDYFIQYGISAQRMCRQDQRPRCLIALAYAVLRETEDRCRSRRFTISPFKSLFLHRGTHAVAYAVSSRVATGE